MFALTKAKCKCLNIINSMCRLLFIHENLTYINPVRITFEYNCKPAYIEKYFNFFNPNRRYASWQK